MGDVFAKATGWRELKVSRATGLYPYFKAIQEQGTEITVDGNRAIMVGSNNYLGLSFDPRVKEAAIRATEKYGASCSGSRLLNGTLDLHAELEERLARFLRKEKALVFSTGFTTNLGTLSAILDRKDVVFSDRQNHASIVEGIYASPAEKKRYRHNDLADLERLLGNAAPESGKLIVTDGVFSMEGDQADLRGMVALKHKYGARILVDEAHGLGVMGPNGRGAAEHQGVEDDIDLVMATFSKSLGSLGGVIAGPTEVIEFVQHKARAMIFQASMTPAAVAAALQALEIVEAEPERRLRLWRIAQKMRAGFKMLGYDTGPSDGVVVPVFVGDQVKCFRFWKALYEHGVFANPVISPAVEPNCALMRTTYMATHTDEQLNRVIEAFEVVGKKFKLIPEEAPLAAEVIAHLGSVDDPNSQAGRTAFEPLPPRAVSVPERTPAELARRIRDLVESATWRAANFELPSRDELNRVVQAKLGDLTGAAVERGYQLFELANRFRNGKRTDDRE